MAVGERRNIPHQDPNIIHAAALNMMQQQSANKTHNNYSGDDEQTVPKSYLQQQMDYYNENLLQDYIRDPLTSYASQLYSSSYPVHHNVALYPVLQPDINITSPAQGQGALTDERVASVARQVSLPYDTDLLEQYINNNSCTDYDFNIDCTDYDNMNNFTLEDYVDLEKVHFPEEESTLFDVAVKQEKPDENNYGNVDKIENILNNAAVNTNNNNVWSVCNNYPENVTVSTVAGSDQTLEEPNNLNFTDILDGFYPSPNSGEWQAEQLGSSSQLSMVSQQFIVKTEPDESVRSQCQLKLQENDSYDIALSDLSVSNEELIEMPVSRFNEFLTSLTQEQCNIVKDIRRRGKNKKAARLCRKRKLDNISTLGDTVTEMEEEKDRLLEERKKIMSETDELKRNIDSICEVMIKGLNSENVILSSDISVLHHSNGQTLLVRE